MDLARYNAELARRHIPDFLELYADVYGVAPYLGDPFFAVETYAARLDGALAMIGFEIVAAYEDRGLIGTGHGVALPPSVAWWQSLADALPDELLAAADNGRVFWLRELMVREAYRNKGLGRQLHDSLTASRREDFVTMTVAVDNQTARRAYLRWGYEIVGRIRHASDSPLYDAMVKANER